MSSGHCIRECKSRGCHSLSDRRTGLHHHHKGACHTPANQGILNQNTCEQILQLIQVLFLKFEKELCNGVVYAAPFQNVIEKAQV